ncbi:MAG: type II CAAX endopeptidase family protein [Planctomycetota bacterium]
MLQDSGDPASVPETSTTVEEPIAPKPPEGLDLGTATGVTLGLGLFWAIAMKWSRPHWRAGAARESAIGTDSWTLPDLLAAFLVFFFGQIIGAAVISPITELRYWQVLSAMLFGGVLSAGFIGLVVRRKYLASWAELGIDRAKRPFRDLTLCLTVSIGLMLFFIPGLVVFCEWLLELVVDDGQSDIRGWLIRQDSIPGIPSGSEGWALRISAIVLAPIFEELLFRGFAIEVLGRRFGPWPALWISSAVFAFVHGEAFIPLFALGLAFGWLYIWRGNLLLPIAAHFFNNFLTITLLAEQ